MKFVVATLGSKGDLHPFLAVARALVERGEDVLFLSQEPHRGEVESQGVQFEAIASAHDHQRTMNHPALWHPIRGFGVLWRHLVVPAIDPTVQILERLCKLHPSSDIRVFASPLVVGARLAVDILPIQLTTGHTAPSGLRSCENPMFIGSWKVPPWLPLPARRMLWQVLDRHKLEPMAAPLINRWRERHHLPALTVPVFGAWLHSPHQVLGMFPPDFGPMPTDWPTPISMVGFPLYEAHQPDATASADLELVEFCNNQEGHAPLLVFYPGSTATNNRASMLEAAVECAQRGMKSLLVGQDWRIHSKRALPQKRLLFRPWISLPNVLPKAKVFIHHGGIGAVAQGLAAGTRQIAIPSAYDQFDNEWRLKTIQPQIGRLTPRSLQGKINRCLDQTTAQHAIVSYSIPQNPNTAVEHLILKLKQPTIER